MSKQKGKKRTRLNVTKPQAEKVVHLHIEEMVMEIEGSGNCHFKRLKYKNCPPLCTRLPRNFPIGTELIDANREEFVREMWALFQSMNKTQTPGSYFSALIKVE